MATAAGAGAAGVAQPAPTPNPVLSFPAAIPSQNEAALEGPRKIFSNSEEKGPISRGRK